MQEEENGEQTIARQTRKKFSYFDSNNAAFVDDFLYDPSVFPDHLSDQIPGHLDGFLTILQHRSCLPNRLIGVPEDLERARLLLQLDLRDAGKLSGRLDVDAVRANRQAHEIFAHTEFLWKAAKKAQAWV